MRLSLPRGMRDLEPEECEMIERIRSAFLEVSRLFSFRVMEPSPIEMLSTLEAKSGPTVREEIYHFKDKGGREVGLRFDLTVGLTRYVASRRDLQLPFKVGTFSSMWRYDEPQYGRYRWFYQWDAEIFGSKELAADAEIIEFTSMLLGKLGLVDTSIQIGDRGITEHYIRSRLGVKDERVVMEMMRALDKIGKKGAHDLKAEYERKGIPREALEGLEEFGRIKGEPDKVLEALRAEGLGDMSLRLLVEELESRGVKGVSVNMGVVRGLDYYTGLVFEAFDEENPDLGALAGGGRYDILPALFGRPDVVATGVAGGVERTMIALSKRGLVPKTEASNMVYVTYVGEGLSKVASKVASNLRNAGIPSEYGLAVRGLRRQMEEASSRSAAYTVIIAPKEYAQGKVVLRDMKRRKEEVVEEKGLVSSLSSLIG